MEAIASAPPHYRDAVIAVDLLGLSYREAAASLSTVEATVTQFIAAVHVAALDRRGGGRLLAP